MGHGSHVLTFPVDHLQKLNIVAFHTTDKDWDDYERTTKMASREDALRDFAGFGKDVHGLLRLADEQLSVVCLSSLTLSGLRPNILRRCEYGLIFHAVGHL